MPKKKVAKNQIMGEQPERLVTLSAKNFKSLRDFTVEFHPFSVLIGPNNSGKTNILQCLNFLAECMKKREIFETFGTQGFASFVWGGQEDLHIEVQMTAVLKSSQLTYGLIIAGPLNRTPFVIKEEAVIRKATKAKTLLDIKEGKGFYLDERSNQKVSFKPGPTLCALSVLVEREKTPTLISLRDWLSQWSFYHFDPAQMREYWLSQEELRLESDGRNLAQVLHSLQSSYPEKFRLILETFHSGFEEAEQITTPIRRDAPKTTISIKEKHFDKPFPSWVLADGELKILAILASLYSPTPPPLIALEEPENFIHPHLLESIVDLLKSASDRIQILLTTHSPLMVDLLDPEDLIIIGREKGQTTVAKRRTRKELKKALEKLSLGELWYSGELGGVPR